MDTRAIGRELLKLEKQYWQALKDKDVATVLRLTDDPCTVTGPQGAKTYDLRDMEQMMEQNDTYTLNDFKIGDDVEIRMLRDDIGIIAYKVHEDLTVEGEPVQLDATESSTWIRRDNRWVCTLHTEAIAGDAFGRDRQRA